jgi:hypothetical protein
VCKGDEPVVGALDASQEREALIDLFLRFVGQRDESG